MVFNKKFIGFNIISIPAPFINEWFLRLDEDIRLCWVEAEFFNLWVFVEVVWGQKTEYYDKKNHIKNVFVMGRQIFLDTMSVCLNNYFKWKHFERLWYIFPQTNIATGITEIYSAFHTNTIRKYGTVDLIVHSWVICGLYIVHN